MATKTALERIRAGAGLEDPIVKKYVEAKKAKRDARLATYQKVEELMKQLP